MRMKGRLIFGISFVLFSLISLFISMHLHQIDGQTSRLRAETLTEQLAEKLFVSTNTVNVHRGNILKKSGKARFTELIYDLRAQGRL